MEFTLTQKDNQVLIYDGHEYSKFREREENNGVVVTWRCRVHHATKCHALLRTRGEVVIGDIPNHCHSANPQKVQTNVLKRKMKEEINSLGATSTNVIGNVLTGVANDILEHLPKKSSLVRNLALYKQDRSAPPPILLTPISSFPKNMSI